MTRRPTEGAAQNTTRKATTRMSTTTLEPRAQIAADRAELAAIKADAVIDKLDANQLARVGRMADLLLLSKRGHLDDESFASFRALGRQVAEDEAVRKTIMRLGEERAKTSVRIRREPRVYGRRSGHSFFGDMITAQDVGSPAAADARDRLNRYHRELAAEARSGSKEGRRVLRTLREQTRQADASHHRQTAAAIESRAMSTGDLSGGALVAPSYIVADYATFRTYSPTFVEQLTTTRPLPPYGMTIEVPIANAGTDVAEQLEENAGLPEGDPTSTYTSAQLQTFVGRLEISQQLADRSGPLDFDSFCWAQLKDQLATAVDTYAIDTALAGVTPATRASFTVPGLLADVGKMSAGLETTNGTVLPPSGLITSPELGEWLLAQVDSQSRPIFLPWGKGGSRQDGLTGYSLSGVPLLLDGNVPAVGTDSQLIVANKSAVFVYQGEPVLEAIPQTDAPFLSVLLRLRTYAAAIVRYPSAVASTTGGAYPASPTWA